MPAGTPALPDEASGSPKGAPEGTGSPDASLREQELIARTGWFILLRWAVVAATFVGLFFLWHLFHMRFPLRPVLGTVAVLLFCNVLFALTAQYLQERGAATGATMRAFANAQMVADLACLTSLVHFLGGADNYFIIFYLFHMVIASILLSRRNAYLLAVIAAGLLNSVIWGEYTGLVEHYDCEALLGPCRLGSPEAAMLTSGTLTLSLFVTVYLTASIAGRLRQREREIETAYDNLRKVDDEKSYFMRLASHELRSPLTAVQSLVHVFLEGHAGDLAARQRELLERMEVRLEALLDLVSDLLRFSRLRVLEAPATSECLDLAEVVTGAHQLFTPWAQEKGVSLTLATEAAPVMGDREGIQEVAGNLISNAIKYTPAGGRVQVQVGRRGQQAFLSVQDTGIGIPAQDQARMFSEFFRARNAKAMTQSGTGLGLAICKHTVELHGGRIRFESEEGLGTSFTVELPVARRVGG